ncbi:UNKNOWN [Stylonychia lemnae]|uniref:Uncharacterized protein n=1 Tax=Stylonychia lemnae TaxID=5949 RepID=A0A077ZRF2_STYLE|nr:UNKNOWN [Stylonychia lemnae]|eukprot:CDW72472.1 UNKNOWN [Stylonychia lemnae]
MIDKSIIKASLQNEKIMSYYFDKFNVKLKDLNPFSENIISDLNQRKNTRSNNDEYSLTQRNLSRMMLMQQYNARKMRHIHSVMTQSMIEAANTESKQFFDRRTQSLLIGSKDNPYLSQQIKEEPLTQRKLTFNDSYLENSKENLLRAEEKSTARGRLNQPQQDHYKTQQQFNQNPYQNIKRNSRIVTSTDRKRIEPTKPYQAQQNTQDELIFNAYESQEEPASKKQVHKRSSTSFMGGRQLYSSQEIRDKVHYNNKGFLFKDQLSRHLQSRNDSNRQGKPCKNGNFEGSQLGMDQIIDDDRPKDLGVSFYSNKTHIFGDSDPNQTFKSLNSQRKHVQSNVRRSQSKFYDPLHSLRDSLHKFQRNDVTEIQQQYQELRNDFIQTQKGFNKQDKKSYRLINKLKKVLAKQKDLGQDIESINLQAKEDFEDYFNKKMKTFCMNEQRKITFNKQKLDYAINRKIN